MKTNIYGKRARLQQEQENKYTKTVLLEGLGTMMITLSVFIRVFLEYANLKVL